MQDMIGETAGRIWQHLNTRGTMTTSRLTKELGEPRDQVQRAIGWLARENKLTLERVRNSEKLSLR